MKEGKIFDNHTLFVLYGVVNLLLLLFLLCLLIFLFNDIYILSRTGFVVFVGLHLFLLFFVKIHYVGISYDEKKQRIEFHYNRRFGLKWKQKIRTVVLPLKQFDGYLMRKDAMGIETITFYKLERKERFELGPFHLGFVSKKSRKHLEGAFGQSL